MKEDTLFELSMQLSVDVLKLTRDLRAKHETTISNQISRSATSVCANIAESKYGNSRADLLQNLKSPSKKQTKQIIGLDFCLIQTESAKKITKSPINYAAISADF